MTDILCFTETSMALTNVSPLWLSEYNIVFSHSTRDRAKGGIAAAYRKSYFKHEIIEIDREILIISFSTKNFKFIVAVLY